MAAAGALGGADEYLVEARDRLAPQRVRVRAARRRHLLLVHWRALAAAVAAPRGLLCRLLECRTRVGGEARVPALLGLVASPAPAPTPPRRPTATTSGRAVTLDVILRVAYGGRRRRGVDPARAAGEDFGGIDDEAGIEQREAVHHRPQHLAVRAKRVAVEALAAQELQQRWEECGEVDGQRQLDSPEVARAEGVIEATRRAGQVVVRRPHFGVIQPARERPVERIALLSRVHAHHREAADVIVRVDAEVDRLGLAHDHAERRAQPLVHVSFSLHADSTETEVARRVDVRHEDE